MESLPPALQSAPRCQVPSENPGACVLLTCSFQPQLSPGHALKVDPKPNHSNPSTDSTTSATLYVGLASSDTASPLISTDRRLTAEHRHSSSTPQRGPSRVFPRLLSRNRAPRGRERDFGGRTGATRPGFALALTESQNSRRWKGPLWVTQSNPPAEAGSPRAGCTAPRPGGS